MQTPIERILDFHATRNFGNRENMQSRAREARELYVALFAGDAAQLAEAALADSDEELLQTVLCCLACLQPGSLASFQDEIVRRRILFPGVIYHGAEERIAEALLPLLEEERHCNHALRALAWIGNERVLAAFARWREQPPAWAARLHVPPHHYARQAGWELTPGGERRDLFSRNAYPLAPPSASDHLGGVRTGVPNSGHCGWCGGFLIGLLRVDDTVALVPGHGAWPIEVLSCPVCSCYGTVFGRRSDAGDAVWHSGNVRPGYLPADTADWPPFPQSPLVLAGSSRHILAAANWMFLPGGAFSQVGGLPTWIQDAAYPACPDCSRTMTFLGQISNEDYDERAEGIYYAFHCPECGVTATSYQQS